MQPVEGNAEIGQEHVRSADMAKRGYGGADGKEASKLDGRVHRHFGKVCGCRMEGTDSLDVRNSKVAEAVLGAVDHLMPAMVGEKVLRLVCTDDLRHR